MDGAFEPRLEDYRLLTGAGNFQDDEATAGAAHIASVRLVNQRIVMAPMEPRAGVAVYEPETDRYVPVSYTHLTLPTTPYV